MGNNHDKYFGKQKRKILVLGLQSSGKTTLVNSLITKQMNSNVIPTKDLNIKDLRIQNLIVTFFDLAGGQRQRVFWKQHYQGTQGIIYLIDGSSSQQCIQISIKQLQKVMNNQDLQNIPFAIGISKSQLIGNTKKDYLNHLINKRTAKFNQKIGIFKTSINDFLSFESLTAWLISNTKPL